jgi:hypothetical protein
MSSIDKGALIDPNGKRPAPWRSSLYEEPTWVSLAWLLVPSLFAAIAIYFAIR